MHSDLTYHFYPNQHSYDRSKPGYRVLSRSLDAGMTWEGIRTEAFSEENPQVLDRPDGFRQSGLCLSQSGQSVLWYSDDRGHHWQGPFLFPDFKIEHPLTSRTNYLIDDQDTLLAFLSAKAPSVQAGLQDRAFSARTNDGGLTWAFQGWMTAYPYGVRSVMPSTVRLQDHELLSVVRRRIDAHEKRRVGAPRRQLG